jgi:hypothetical protein
MDAATLIHETTRYLEAVDLFRSLEMDVRWRSEAEEIGPLSTAPPARRSRRCERCGCPLVRIDGRHICLRCSEEQRLAAA